MYNLAKGAAFGLSHNFMQVGYLRPHNRHHRYSNLYFVGSSTHPGTGLPMVLLSARLTTERILKEIGVPYPVLSQRLAVAG
jgi:phytoene dehydrogenase-like protein